MRSNEDDLGGHVHIILHNQNYSFFISECLFKNTKTKNLIIEYFLHFTFWQTYKKLRTHELFVKISKSSKKA